MLRRPVPVNSANIRIYVFLKVVVSSDANYGPWRPFLRLTKCLREKSTRVEFIAEFYVVMVVGETDEYFLTSNARMNVDLVIVN